MRIAGVSGMRSFETSVSTLLSSITVFIDSIHTASMSPSSTTHLAVCAAVYGDHSFDMLRMTIDRQPSFQSFESVMKPYSSSLVTDLGLSVSYTATGLAWPSLWHAASVFHTVVLPVPAGPSSMTECRTLSSSWYCTTFETKTSSLCCASSLHTLMHFAWRFWSIFVGRSSRERSAMRRRKMGMSLPGILGVLKSRSARIRMPSSSWAPRFSAPRRAAPT